jgi:ribosomal protein S18 acetylase RimI-like enzyme
MADFTTVAQVAVRSDLMNAQRSHVATIEVVGPDDFVDLLPLVRDYCDFYEADPSDSALLALFATLSKDRAHEGLQLLARGPEKKPHGFATLYWTWSTTHASRIGVMEDLFVIPEARGTGVAQQLIVACQEHCRARGASRLSWQTAPSNQRAQRLYDRIGAIRDEWIDYSLDV